jgi:hypothetical protein
MNYKWSIQSVELELEKNSLRDVVKSVRWVYQATEDEYNAAIEGEVILPSPTKEAFVEFGSLNEQKVIGWLEQGYGSETIQSMQSRLADQIEAKKNPKTRVVSNPWSEAEVDSASNVTTTTDNSQNA